MKDNVLDSISSPKSRVVHVVDPDSDSARPETTPVRGAKVVEFKKPEPKKEEYVPPTPLGSWDTEFGKVTPLGSFEESTRGWLRKGFSEAVGTAFIHASEVVLNDACVTFEPGNKGRFLSLGFESSRAASRFLEKFKIEHRVHADTQSLKGFLREKGVLRA